MSAPAGQQGGIVAVGYGGSAAAQLAVRWAAGYAAAAGLNLRVVHAWVWPVFTKNLGPVKGVADSGLRHSAEAILAEGVELARTAALEAPEPRRRASSVPFPTMSRNAPAPPSTASWRPGSRHPCCETPPGTPGCWWSAAGALAPSWTRWPARSASIWPAPHRAR